MTLFSPLTVRDATLPSRVGIPPMCMYASREGLVTDFHVAHPGRFALGGFGLVVTEATAAHPQGRIFIVYRRDPTTTSRPPSTGHPCARARGDQKGTTENRPQKQ